MKKIVCSLLIIFVIIVLISCKRRYEIKSYYDANNEIVIEVNGITYHMHDGFHISNTLKRIGRVRIDGEKFSVFANYDDSDLIFLIIKSSIFADKALPLYVRDDFDFPQLSNFKNCYLYYKNEKYEYDISKYYMTDSDINELEGSITTVLETIYFEDISSLEYWFRMYIVDEHYYIKNYEEKYIELENFPE